MFKRTTDSKHGLGVAENLLDRKFEVAAPDTAWTTDITYVRTWQGWMYLAVVIDLFSRRVVGWSMATHMRTGLVMGALKMALGRRLPSPKMLHHSDRGSQYASNDYRDALRDNNIICSMSRKGNCWDNGAPRTSKGDAQREMREWPLGIGLQGQVPNYAELLR